MHAGQHIPAELSQEIQAQLDTKCLWAEVSLKHDHHQPCW